MHSVRETVSPRELSRYGGGKHLLFHVTILATLVCLVAACGHRIPRAPVPVRPTSAAGRDDHPAVMERDGTPGADDIAPRSLNGPAGPASNQIAGARPQESQETKAEPNCDSDVGQPVVDATTKRLIAELVRLRRPQKREGLAREDGSVSRVPLGNIPRIESISVEVVRRMLGTLEKRAVGCGSALAATIESAINGAIDQGAKESDEATGPCILLQGANVSPPKWVAWIGQWKPCDRSSHKPYVFEETRAGVSLLLAVDIGPTYTDGARVSPWHTLIFRGFSPGPSLDRPRLVFADRVTALWSEDDDIGITGTKEGFAIRFWSSTLLDEGRPREHVRSYRRHDGQFDRVQPFVAQARDLPDEWLRLPWSGARRLCASGRQVELKPWHARITTAIGRHEQGYPFMVLEAESADLAAARSWVTFKCDRCKDLPAHIHFEMIRDGNGYLIDSVSSEP